MICHEIFFCWSARYSGYFFFYAYPTYSKAVVVLKLNKSLLFNKVNSVLYNAVSYLHSYKAHKTQQVELFEVLYVNHYLWVSSFRRPCSRAAMYGHTHVARV